MTAQRTFHVLIASRYLRLSHEMPQVSSAKFGPLASGQLPLDCSVAWRDLPEGGLGINTNYLMDISPEWRNAGGPTFSEALKARMLHWLACSAMYRAWCA